MNNLPGLGALRMLPLQGALGRYQLWQCALANSLKTRMFAAYRSVRCRLMRRMSAAMLHRRSNLSFLERRPIDATSVANYGCARLPVSMRYNPKTLAQKRLSGSQLPLIMPSSNVWAGLMAQRTFATMAHAISRAKDEKRRIRSHIERPLVPILEFVEQPDEQESIKSEHKKIDAMPKKASKHQRPAPVVRYMDGSDRSEKQRPPVPTLEFRDQPEPLGGPRKTGNASWGVHGSMSTRHETEPLAKRQLSAKLSHFALKRSSNLQYMLSKYPLMHKLESPVMEYLSATNAIPQTLDTFETRLRALRTAQPLKFRLPSLADSDNLNVTQQYRRYWMPRFANMSGSKRFGPAQIYKSSAQVQPQIKAYKKRRLANKSMQKKKPPQQEKATKKVPKPPVKPNELSPAGASKRLEREDLNYLLGDLLEKNEPEPQNVSIEFNKKAPLCKLVTGSLEGRSKLYNRAFDKQLASPQLYQHPTIRNMSEPPRTQRPAGFLGQSAVFRAKTLLENKLSMLLNATQENDDDD